MCMDNFNYLKIGTDCGENNQVDYHSYNHNNNNNNNKYSNKFLQDKIILLENTISLLQNELYNKQKIIDKVFDLNNNVINENQQSKEPQGKQSKDKNLIK